MVEVTCSTTLFTVGTFPMVFVLTENDENIIVSQMIQHGGGCISSSRGPYGICLSSPKRVIQLRNEVVFSTDFIKDCCMANRILDINQYRLGRPSSCPDGFDAMKVLLRQSCWPTFAERDQNDSAQTDRHSDSDATMESQNSRRNISSSQRAFSGNEEEGILRYIVENKEIGLIQGNTLWKKIAQRKVRGRTWQSLKKYFLKHMLPNITKYKFLSVTDRLEFQKHHQETAESGDGGSSSDVVSQRHPEEHRSNIFSSLHKPTASGDRGSCSKMVSQRHLEQHRSNRLPSPSESPVNNDGSSLERGCGRRRPEKRKPFNSFRALESNDSDSDSDTERRPGNTDDQRLRQIHQFNRSTSSQVHRENKDDRQPRKQDDPQQAVKNKTHTIQRQQSVIDSSDEVDSGNEEHHGGPVVQRKNEERRKSSDNSSPDNDWFLATNREPHYGNTNTTGHKRKTTRKKRREEFTMEEECAILTYLQKHNRFSNTGGNNVWKNMAATEPVGKRHTWQSLRERYLKKIVPNINRYNLPEEIKRRVKCK